MLKKIPTVDYGTVLQTVLREYHEKHDLTMLPIKVDFLAPIVEGKGIVQKIELYEVEFQSQTLAAAIEIFDGSAEVVAKIKLASVLDDYWKRIAQCKEMYHCMIDCTESVRVRDVDDLFQLTDGLASRLSPLHSKLINPNIGPLDTEIDAELLAMETLFPYELRVHHFDAYYRGEVSATKLAERYKIPEYYVPLSMERTHMERIRQMRLGRLVSIKRPKA